MNKNIIEGKWEQVKGIIQKEWGKLTDDDLDMIGGDERRLQGKLQEMYGMDEEEYKKEMDRVLKDHK